MSRGLRRGTTLAVLLTFIVIASLAVASLVSAQTPELISAPESASVGTSGGTLSFASGDVTVKVPDGATSGTIDLSYTPWTAATSPAAAPSGTVFGSQLFELDVSIGGVAQTSYAFSGFVQVTIQYTDADKAQAAGGRDDNVDLYVYDAAFNRWNQDASAVQDIVNKSLTSSQTALGAAGASGFAIVITTSSGASGPGEATPPAAGDIAPGSGLLIGIALAGAILVLGGGYLFRRGSKEA